MYKKSVLILSFFLSGCFAKQPQVNVQSFNLTFLNNLNNTCQKIAFQLIDKNYLKYIKNIKKTSYTFSATIFTPGISITYSPYLDKKEKLEIQEKIRENYEKNLELLFKYARERRKALLYKKFLNWKLKRVDSGVEKMKDNLKYIQSYENAYIEYKSLEKSFFLKGISKDDLNTCYKWIYQRNITYDYF